MRQSRPEGRREDVLQPSAEDRRRSEAGDTLVEILIALTVIGIAATAILLAFATSISGSGAHRNEVNLDTMLRTASAEVTAALQQQPATTFATCAGAYTYHSPGSIPLPNSQYSAYVSLVAYQSANPSAAANTYSFSANEPPSTTCPSSMSSPNEYANSPQMLTISVTYSGPGGGTATIQTVVGDPHSPSSVTTTCGSSDPPAQLVFLQQPTDGPNGSAGSAGSALYPQAIVQIQDSNDKPCDNDIATVALSITAGTGTSGALLQDCSPTSGSNAETVFAGCAINEPNVAGHSYTLTATDAVDHLTAVTNPFDVSAGTPAQLVFTTEPGNGTGGSPFGQPVVEIEDSLGHLVTTDTNPVTLAIGTNPGGGSLSGCTGSTSGGIATFSGCTIDKIGTGYTLTASDATDGLVPVTSNGFNITPGQPYRLSFTTTPGTASAGSAFGVQPVVTLLDKGGNVATVAPGSTNTVALAIGTNPSGGVLSGCTETTTAGIATFSGCSINKAGAGYTLVATDTTTPSVLSATSNAFNVKASPTVTAVGPGTGTAGTAITAGNISSVLAGGTTTPTVSGTITFTVFGPQTTAPTTCTSGGTTVGTATVNGNATYNPSASFTPTGAGNYWWYASYGGDANNSTATSTCSGTMSKTVVAKASPTVTASGPAAGATGATIATGNITSTLAASSGTNATGTITWKVFGPQTTAPTTCTTGGSTVGTATVNGNATYNPSAGFTPTTIGDYWWYASYGGDTNNNTATSTCGTGMSETVVGKASPTLTASGPGTIPIGTAITATNISSVLGASSGANATGTITFTVFGPVASAPTTCTTGGTTVGTATVSGNATYHPSAGFTPGAVGDYWWYASYGGDANNNTATSTCGSLMAETVVAKFAPTVSATGPGSGTIGTAITATNISSVLAGGTTAPAVSGTITFTVFGPQSSAPTTCTTGGTTVGTGTTVNGNATYHPSAGFTPTGAGDYWWYASYGGDADNNTATSTCGAGMSETTVAKASPTLTATGPGTGTIGTPIAAGSISSALAGGTTAPVVTGTVTFTVFGPQASAPTTCTTGGTTVGTGTTVNGNATYHPTAGFTPTGAGNYWWYASYGGDANNNTATSTCGAGMSETTVAKFSPTLTATGPGTGTAGTAIAAGSISSALAGGTTAPAATGTVTFTVFGPQATAPTTCTTGGTTVGTGTTVNGNATYNPTAGFTPTTIGDYWWYASYGGDANNNTATSTCGSLMSETVVGKASPTLTATGPGTGTAGTAIAASAINSTLAASSGANATGTITFTVFGPQSTAPTTCTSGGTTVGTGTTVSGNATYHPSAGFTPGAAGDYWWYASYGGDTNNNTATSTCSGTMSETVVAKASPTLTATGPGSGTAGTAITAANISSVLAGGTTTPAATGTVTFTVFGPQASAPTTCTTGGTTVGTGTTVNGNATYHPSAGFTPTGAGNYWWYASYGGDTNNNTATSTCSGTMSETVVGKASPTLTATGPGTGTIGTPIAAGSISSVLAGGTTTPAATGTVTFTVFGPQSTAPTTCTTGGTTVGTGTSVNGNATYHPSAGFTPGAAGDYWWYASYGGDTNNNTATSNCGAGMSETTVAKFSPTVTVGAPGAGTAGTAIAAGFINSVLAGGTTTPAATGTITFTVFGPQSTAPTTCTTGGTTVGTATVNGNATYIPSAGFTPGAAGDYWWYASYGGDTNNNTATSTCSSLMSETVVGKASPTLTATGPGTGTAGTAIAVGNINSVLAGGTTTPAATGTITFTVFGPQASAPTTCTTGGTTVGTGTTVNGNATYHPSAGFTPGAAGDYWWYASYGGDTNNNTATSTCGTGMSETVVGKASPTLTATGPGSGTAGTAITATNISSVLAGGTTAPVVTGTITFTVFGPQSTAPTTCTTGGTTVGTGTTVNGNATYHPSAGFTPGAAGDYWWYASYGGDTNNNTATSTCSGTMSETTVAKASPTLTATGPGTGTIGTPIAAGSISSALAGGTTAPVVTGTITFTVFGPQSTAPTTCTTGGTTVGTGTTVNGNATYNPTAGFTPTGAGNYWWYASYGGDANNNTATSTCGAGMSETTVAKFSPTLTATGPGTGTAGTAITAGSISSVLAGGTTAPAASGTITFTVFGPQSHRPDHLHHRGHDGRHRATVNGNATYNPTAGFTPTATGDYWWYASYGGDANNNTATSTCGSLMSETVVGKASPTLTATGPGTGTAGTAIAASAINSTLAGVVGLPTPPAPSPSRSSAPRAPPRPPAPAGAPRWAPGPRSAATPPTTRSAGFTPGAAGDYWWYASYGGDTNNNTATSTCGAAMSETVVGKASPTLTATGPGTGTAGTTIAASAINSTLAASSGANATGTITFTVFGPQTPPRPPAPPGVPRWAPGPRSTATPPTTPRPASRRARSVTTGGTRPMAVTRTTTRRPRPVVPGCPRPWWARPPRR